MSAPFQESALQTYVVRRFAHDLPRWLPLSPRDVRLLGAQVPCANGRIDVLGALNYLPVIVELKAEPADERVAGQLQRYKAAVEAAFSACYWEAAFARNAQHLVLAAESFVTCIVIAPDFAPKAVDALSPFAWLLRAESTSAGEFCISSFDGTQNLYRCRQAPLTDVLRPLAGASIDDQLARVCEPLPFDEPPCGEGADL